MTWISRNEWRYIATNVIVSSIANIVISILGKFQKRPPVCTDPGFRGLQNVDTYSVRPARVPRSPPHHTMYHESPYKYLVLVLAYETTWF